MTTSPFEAFNRYEKRHDIPKDFIRQMNATNPDNNAWARLERDQITLDQFNQEFESESAKAGHPVQGRDVIALLSGDLRINMVKALKKCREHFTVACLTNNIKSRKKTDRVQTGPMAEVMALFDLVVESSKEGLRKPDPRFYQKALAKLKVDPCEALFLDDLGINLKPAKAMGMRTIKVISEDQALAELSAATGLELP